MAVDADVGRVETMRTLSGKCIVLLTAFGGPDINLRAYRVPTLVLTVHCGSSSSQGPKIFLSGFRPTSDLWGGLVVVIVTVTGRWSAPDSAAELLIEVSLYWA